MADNLDAGGVDALATLNEVRRCIDVDAPLDHLLDVVAASLGAHRAAVTLVERGTREIVIDAAVGLTPTEQHRGRYQFGEGVTGRVVQTREPIVVDRVADAPHFLNRTGARQTDPNGAFVCVPILAGGESVGTISVDVPATERDALERLADLLSIVGTMIAQMVVGRQATAQADRLAAHITTVPILGRSKAIKPVIEMIESVAHSDATVLIRGESGVGKELVADAIHYASPRRQKPLIKVNCAALASGILESELFGHEKGAFTGAATARQGRFELAHGGTIFLDEIGDFSASTQITLLRILQERTFERVGGNKTIKADVRVVAATNRDLDASMADGSFRHDLYYRLAVFPIHVPPLRERRTDILLLADAFAERCAKNANKEIRRITSQAIDMLMAYHWPGNVRELENCMERAVLLTKDGVIHGHHLPPTLQTAEATGTALKGDLEATLEAVERDLIHDALKTSRGNMAKAARELGMTERKMGLRIKRFEIDPKRYRLTGSRRSRTP